MKKEIILFNPHRNSVPLLIDENKQKFLFLNYMLLWKATRLLGKTKKKRIKLFAFILSVIRPRYIIDINWIDSYQRMFLVWCKKHRPSQFIVIQHGLYIGGKITDRAHRYIKADVVLCWGKLSRDEFRRHNPRRRVELFLWGNPLYNQFSREKFHYRESIGRSVLFLPTVVSPDRIGSLQKFIETLNKSGFKVYLKPHRYQEKLSVPIVGGIPVTGNIYEMLRSGAYDIIVSDTSTSLIDAIYYKQRVLYFSPPGDLDEYEDNYYARYLRNIALENYSEFGAEAIIGAVSIERQERLLEDVVTQDSNALSRLNFIR